MITSNPITKEYLKPAENTEDKKIFKIKAIFGTSKNDLRTKTFESYGDDKQEAKINFVHRWTGYYGSLERIECIDEGKTTSDWEEVYNTWWCSLSQSQKCHIASKATNTTIAEGKYASQLWNEFDMDKKQWIFEHCTDKHGMIQSEWQEGNMMSE